MWMLDYDDSEDDDDLESQLRRVAQQKEEGVCRVLRRGGIACNFPTTPRRTLRFAGGAFCWSFF